jgi:hypothetical protein
VVVVAPEAGQGTDEVSALVADGFAPGFEAGVVAGAGEDRGDRGAGADGGGVETLVALVGADRLVAGESPETFSQ